MTVSNGDEFNFVNIFENTDESEEDENDKFEAVQDEDEKENSSSKTACILNHAELLIHDWALVNYKNNCFPGEITHIARNDFEVNVMHWNGTKILNWPAREDKIYYHKNDIIKKLKVPNVAGSHGHFFFPGLQNLT